MQLAKVKYLAVFLVLILSLTLFAGCELLTGTSTSPTPPASPNPPVTSTTPTTKNTAPINSSWTLPLGESDAPILPSIADVVAKVKPSVVAINTEVTTRLFTQEGAGSGWIITEDGYIVTNNHVVEGAQSITVTLDDGRTLPVDMKTVATDPLADLAVFKINAENLPAVSVGDSDSLRIGDWVVAIGNSLGRGIRATQGIVSRQDVSIVIEGVQTLYGLIETDAAINPGNSGGPLVNMAGEVIGINSVKIVQEGVEGVGYAISTRTAIPIIEDLIKNGYVIRPWLGVGLYTVDQFAVQRYNLTVDKGILVVNVAPGSPAAKAGLKPGDVITGFEDQEITEVNELIRAIHSAEVGQQVTLTYWRGETQQTTQATLVKSPPPS